MIKIENECCNCAVPGYPCRGDLCPLQRVVRIYCDKCRAEITGEKFYRYNEHEYCSDCTLDILVKDGVIEREDD